MINENEDCGCNGPKLILREGQEKITLSEGLKHHIREGKMLINNIYRPLSKQYFALINEARELYDQGLLSVVEDDAELLESDLGKFDFYNNVKVPLDYIFDLDELENLIGENKNTHNIILTFDDERKINRVKTTPTFQKMLWPNQMNSLKVGDNKLVVNNVALNGLERMASMGLYTIKKDINEAKKDKKKTPPIGKPKRGGSKKFYVYVRKPGGGIKKVSFGDTTGLRAKLNNPKARKAFAARHKCAQAKDRTTARYWSCRLPRMAKSLGFKTSFTGYW